MWTLGDVSDGCDLAGERVDREGGTGCPLDEPVPADRLPGREEPRSEKLAGLRAVDDPAGLGAQRVPELERDDRAVQVGVVVDRRGGDVDLRRPVRRLPTLRRRELLVAGDELPPRGVEVSRRDPRTGSARTRS